MFSGLDQMPAYDNKRRALLVTTPGETRSFGNAIIQRFFRSGGWYVYSSPGAKLQHISALVAQEWLGVVGFSLSTEMHVESLRAAIETVRKMSMNRNRCSQATALRSGWGVGPGQKFVDAGLRMAVDDPGEDVGEVGLRVDAVELAGLDERGDDGPVLSAAVGAGEERILAIEGDGTDGALDDVGVDLDAAVVEEAGEPLPSVTGRSGSLRQAWSSG